jgi:tRNA threonylcarbamoyladenosine biosynthesis protein TsaE
MRELSIATADDMRALGVQIASTLKPGDLVVLTGDLGAGKTTLVQGIASGLGASGPVLSPTFVIARVYRDGRIPLVHVDAYRLGSKVEVDDLDLDADIAEAVTVVEWGEGLVEGLSDSRTVVHISRSVDQSDETRHVSMT